MADLEKQNIAIELRKFRKKLRQIEKLEELERDLTEEEFLKLSRKDEVRSKVQELVARDEELSSELKTMESAGQQDEQTSSNEQEEATNIPATVETQAEESSQEVISENVLSENEQASLNEICNQTPESTCPRIAEVETANTAITREPLMSSSNRTYMKFFVRNLEGHNDVICDVACSGSVLVSGSRDTMLKLWDADTGREMRSMGGHTGTITSVFLLPKKGMSSCEVPSSFRTDQYSVLTGSKDCSMKIWSLSSGQIKRSMYAFSPVECLDCTSNLTAAGLDGGKLELWDLETGAIVRSVRGHDEDAVTAVKFQGDRVISGSATGVVKVWDIRDNSLKPVMSSDQAPVDQTDAGVTVKPRRVRCLTTTEETVYWGDDGVNIKAMDLNSGKLRKIRNHVAQFGSTGAMATAGSCLVSAGYDLDRGNGYLNVRSLPSEQYLATVNDESTGSITCLSCTQATRDQVTLHKMCTGGMELKL
ncbi:probable E3 ubiquitin ligase complex SCF subunit sconB [Orbicella faveolata]|uniref:probable E3 ubiquitin ligase complex SCF subunit sconB n=1 Tax=Orbicella faveolata TaxID=48498 RepID=UPI0009E2F077|nr:probable E3 ubiquitin ligase complex SCF subunit sconB [Orbicella faveolata]